MLEILNILRPFFEDCHREYGVREYAKVAGTSPATASARLKALEKEGLLSSRNERRYLLFSAQKEDPRFIELSRIYWRERLGATVLPVLTRHFPTSNIIMFGSASKADVAKDSDIDIAVISGIKTLPDLSAAERKLGRKTHLILFSDESRIPKSLKKNILGAYVLKA